MDTRRNVRARRWTFVSSLLLLSGSLSCSSSTSAPTPRTAANVSRFAPVDTPRPNQSPQDLLQEALAGTSADGDALDSRMEVRTIRVPHPERGATARFNFGQGQRGWITSMPNDELLTNPAFDPGSKIPEYKVCAVRVEPLASPVPARA